MAKLLRFAVVGGLGTALNLGLFYLLADLGRVSPSVAAVLCFAAAVTSNYLLNHAWTFRAEMDGERPSPGRYVRFVAVSLVGLGVNLAVLNLVLVLLHPALKVFGQAAGIACGVVTNYIGSDRLAFRRKLHWRYPA